MKLTFKKEKRKSGLVSFTTIKHNKKEIGLINSPTNLTTEYEIQIAVKQVPTEEDPCCFRWIFLREKFNTEPHAREYLNDQLQSILDKYKLDLHYFGERN